MDFLKNLVSAEKLGGWVRAFVASSLPAALAAWGIAAYVPAEAQTAVSVLASTVVVGLWSHFVKS